MPQLPRSLSVFTQLSPQAISPWPQVVEQRPVGLRLASPRLVTKIDDEPAQRRLITAIGVWGLGLSLGAAVLLGAFFAFFRYSRLGVAMRATASRSSSYWVLPPG